MCHCSTSFPPHNTEKHESHQTMLSEGEPSDIQLVYNNRKALFELCSRSDLQCALQSLSPNTLWPFQALWPKFSSAGARVQDVAYLSMQLEQRPGVHSQPGLGSSFSTHGSEGAYACSKWSWKHLLHMILYWWAIIIYCVWSDFISFQLLSDS